VTDRTFRVDLRCIVDLLSRHLHGSREWTSQSRCHETRPTSCGGNPRAGELPYGRLRNTRLEEVVAEADALGEERLGAAARIVLMSSYSHSDEHPKLFTPFAWLLARYDQKPPWMGDWERYNVLWRSSGSPPECCATRGVAGADRGRAADMARRYAEAARRAPVLGCRFQVTARSRS